MNETRRIRDFILETFLFTNDEAALADDESLLEKGIIDSTGVLELVTFLESEFGITVEDEELLPDNLDSVNRVGAYVIGKRG